jgi:hypothetical protein
VTPKRPGARPSRRKPCSDGNPAVDSCLDCHAWGARRWGNWLCHGCRSWRREHATIASCRICSTVVTVGPDGYCRLCRKQGTLIREDKQLLDMRAANKHGQQLFLADMFYVSARDRRPRETPSRASGTPDIQTAPTTHRHDPAQLRLFAVRRDLSGLRGREHLIDRCDPNIAARVDAFVAEHGHRHGWTEKEIADTRLGIGILYAFADDPAAPIKASDALVLRPLQFPITRILRVLDEQGLLIDDRQRAIDAWFADKIADLPEPMRDQLGVWFLVMRDGSKTPPRRKPRAEASINAQLRNALPAVRAWAKDSKHSLREISRDDVLAVLPEDRNDRAGCGQALKSIFSVLKERKIVFVNPLARLHTGYPEPKQSLPQDPAVLRDALNSHDPSRAIIVALIAYHGLRMGQVRRIHLTDISDGRLTIDQRTIPLAPAVTRRLAAYLDERNATWPSTVNPHLFVNSRSAWRDTPVGHRWVQLKIGEDLTVQRIREDRILDEAHASRGDTRRISDLFGLSVPAASRYTNTVEHAAFAASAEGNHE